MYTIVLAWGYDNKREDSTKYPNRNFDMLCFLEKIKTILIGICICFIYDKKNNQKWSITEFSNFKKPDVLSFFFHQSKIPMKNIYNREHAGI